MCIRDSVVTQPKPEFTRPNYAKDTLNDSIEPPPAFLLKKNPDKALSGESQDVDEFDLDSGLSVDAEKLSNEPKSNHNVAKSDVNEKVEGGQDDAPDFSLNIQEGPKAPKKDAPEASLDAIEKDLSFAEQAKRFVRRNRKTVADKIRKEPVIANKQADDQMRIDFEQSEGAEANNHSIKSDESINESSNNKKQTKETAETDVLVLNVRASDENPIQGAALLPMLLTLGFKFGEHDIFHRHVNTNGKGPILFSLTNMFKPGVFDIDNIENFSTYGVSLFMMLPIEGDAQQVFNMMHNAARKISDEFSCRILDGNKVGLSKQSLQQYVERIREFERKRFTQE